MYYRLIYGIILVKYIMDWAVLKCFVKNVVNRFPIIQIYALIVEKSKKLNQGKRQECWVAWE